MEIYWGSGGQPSWRVLLALELKGLAYDSKLISFQKGEHKSPEFLRMNPRHKVPTLRDGDVVVYESIAILAYLDAAYPDPPLFGRTFAETAEIWRRVMEFSNYLDGPLNAIVRPVFFSKVEENRSKIDESVPLVQEELEALDRALEHREYFVTENVTAADIVVFPSLMALDRAAGKPGFAQLGIEFLPISKNFPRLAAWMGRMELLPGYEKTYPPHWRES